jgi:hypothetical protein
LLPGFLREAEAPVKEEAELLKANWPAYSGAWAANGIAMINQINAMIFPPPDPDPPDPSVKPEEGDPNKAASWSRSEWQQWFDAHPFTTSHHAMTVLTFVAANAGWLVSNSSWRIPLYTAWAEVI